VHTEQRQVATAAQLAAAAADPAVADIVVAANLSRVPTLRLSPGQTLKGAGPGVVVHFAPDRDGLQLSTDNRVEGLELRADVERRALFNDTRVERLGRLVVLNLRINGVVELLARDKVRSGHVEAENVDVIAAEPEGSRSAPRDTASRSSPVRSCFGISKATALSRSRRISRALRPDAPAPQCMAAAFL
jgi:hypothetical protein